MQNNSSKNRLVKITAKVFIMLLAVVMSLSVLPAFSADILPSANADVISYEVPTNATKDTINEKLSSYAAGSVVNMKLYSDIDLTDTSTKTYSEGFVGIKIPSGITVNLFMNGYKIVFNRPDDSGAYRLPYFYAIENKGTLNIYSGSSETSPNEAAAISIVNSRNSMNADTEKASTYVALEAIHNEGVLSVKNKVSISVYLLSYYDESSSKSSEQITDAVTAIFNESDASCVVDGALIDVYAFAYAHYHTKDGKADEGVNSTAAAYGIYGGNITVTGGTKINSEARAEAKREKGSATKEDGRSKVSGLSYGIVSKDKVEVNGATITAKTHIWGERAFTDSSSSVNHYSGGIYTITGKTPVITDADITVNQGHLSYGDGDVNGEVRYREGTVVSSSVLPASATEMVKDNISFNPYYQAWPSSDVSAGSFFDEAGNTYNTFMATSKDSHPTSIERGALAGTQRVHVVYRYWKDKNRTQIDTSVVGNDGNVGYSYAPLSDGTEIVKDTLVLDGITDSTHFTKKADATIGYVSGGEACNSYYWNCIGLYYQETEALFCDFNVVSRANQGKLFKNFNAENPANNRAPAVSGKIYIYVDFVKANPTTIRAKVGSSDFATATYTGAPIKASAIGLQILESGKLTDISNEYDIDFTNSKLLPVSFSYTGKNAAGITETDDSGKLPVNAGTYDVTLYIADTSAYNKNSDTDRNRLGIEYIFRLTIEQASPLRGDLRDDVVTFEYGEKLEDVLDLKACEAKGLVNETVKGSFTFANSIDGSSYKGVATKKTVAIVWTPANSSEEQAWNYKTTTFNVTYTVTPKKLTIKPTDATVVYGNSDINFGVMIDGLVANDDNDSVRSEIANAMSYMIVRGDHASSYVPGEVAVGSYVIRPSFNSVPSVLSNYNYDNIVYGEEYGKLTVTKRNITIEASAEERFYSPGDFTAKVSFRISDGLFSAGEAISVLSATGNLRVGENTAGVQIVTGITKQYVVENLITGSASGNYNVESLVFKNGDIIEDLLKVTIKKAVPTVTTPVVSEMFYQNGRKLADVELTDYTASVAGSWKWVDEEINPTVNVGTYKAQFVPDDSLNYETKEADIPIKVKVTNVVISFAGTASYGDNIPNITAYTYKADNDPTFSIDAVKTSGNITPSTTYYKGAPVVDGGYPVVISAPNFVDVNGNYSFTTANGVINVTPRVITFTVQGVTATYGDNFAADASTVSVTYDKSLLFGSDTVTADGSEPTFRFVTDFRYADNYAVGTYYIQAIPSFNVSPNYTVSTVNGTLTVVPAELTIKANDITLEYGSAVPDVSDAFTLIGAKRGETINSILENGEIRVSTNYIVGDEAGKTGLYVAVDNSYATIRNYKVTLQNGKLTVKKATPSVVTNPTAKITHGQTLADAIIDGGVVANDVKGVFVYNTPATAPVYRSEPYTIYEASFIPEDTANYNTVTGLYIKLTVTKKPVVGALSVTGIPMVGGELTVSTEGLNPSAIGVYTIVWYDASNSQIGTGEKLVLNEAYKLQKLTVKAIANAPYVGEVVYTTTVIAPSLTDAKAVLEADFETYYSVTGLGTATYDAEQHSVTVNRTDSTTNSAIFGGVTVKYNGSTDIPKAAGTYKVTIDIATPDGIDSMNLTPSEDGKTVYYGNQVVYSPVADFAIGTLVIEKAEYTVKITIPDKTYDGTTVVNEINVASENGKCGSDDVYFDTASASFRYAQATVGTDIPVNVLQAKLGGAAASNYKLKFATDSVFAADIEKATLKVEVIPVDREYEEGNTSVDLSFEINSDTLATGDDGFVYVDEELVKGEIDTPAAGSDKPVKVSGAVLTGSKAENYELKLVNKNGETLDKGRLSVTIEKATTQSYPIPQVDELTYNSAIPLSKISLGDKRWSWASDVANIVPGAGTHKYLAIFTPDDTANYATVEYEVDVIVKKAVVTVTAHSFSVIYGDNEPTYYYTVEGLTGTDTIKNAVEGYVLLNCSYASGSNAGKYDIVLTGAFESDNYDFIYLNGTVTVNKRVAYVVAEPVSREYEKDNLTVEVKFSEITNLLPADANTVKLSCGNNPVAGTIADANAGVKNVSISEMPTLIGGEVATNYDLRLVNSVVTVEIRKARIPGIILPTEGQVGYGQRLSTTIFITPPVGTESGKFEMENPNSTPTQIGTFSNVYKVVFKPYESQNYATISDYITLNVVASELNVFISFSGTAQVGKSLYVATNNLPADATKYLVYEWYRMDSPDDDIRNGYLVANGADATSYQLTQGDADKYIVCRVTTAPNAPYTCESFCATDSPIKEEVLSFWQKFVNWFYRIISNITQLFGGVL